MLPEEDYYYLKANTIRKALIEKEKVNEIIIIRRKKNAIILALLSFVNGASL